jgi:cellobiose-specific phosphotransferase system component IIB
MRPPPLAAILLLTALLAGQPAEAAASTTPACPAPIELAAPDAHAGALPRVAAALRTGTLDVLAVGSGTMLGPRGRAEGSFADLMAQDLRAALPGVEIRLVVQGERGMTAAVMVSVMDHELDRHHFDLIVWQTGTVEAVRKLPPDEFARTLDAGAALARQQGADLVLVDPQFSRMLQAKADLTPYRAIMQDATRRNGIVLFHRFGLIRTWVDAGALDLEKAPRRDRSETTAELNTCLGQALAKVVLRAANR